MITSRSRIVRMLGALALALLVNSALDARRPASVWVDVPFVPQPRDGCGAASIAMVMQYWLTRGASADPQRAEVAAIQSLLFSPRVHGITNRAMEEYLRQSGFRTFSFAGRWSDLGEQLAAGRPLIVCLRESRFDPLHYVVVDGVDEGGGVAWANDPARRKLTEFRRADFEKEWKASGFWTLLAVPQSVK